ncbi:MAG: hypothetical protein QXN23_07730 [Candidatus Caldarchaeum sp.]|nr:hypothetical protein [Candidatus Caldarchaeales archaeon]
MLEREAKILSLAGLSGEDVNQLFRQALDKNLEILAELLELVEDDEQPF